MSYVLTDFQPYFEALLSNIALDPTRVERIESAVRHLEDVVLTDPLLRRRRPRIVPQGSYAAGLAIRPLRATDEYDVDVVVEMSIGATVPSWRVLDALADRLALDAIFRPRLRTHPRCVRIQYAGDFHLDVVPGRRIVTPGGAFRGVIKAPDRERGWRTSNPRGFLRWCVQRNNLTGGDFERVVVMLKRWRDLQVAERRRVRSIVFTTLIGLCVPRWTRSGASTRPDADVLVETLQRLDRYLGSRRRVPILRNPSLAGENLARSWPQTHFEEFRDQVSEALDDATFARAGRGASAWRRLFGDAFPTSA